MKWLNWPNRFTIARIVFVGPLVICLLNMGQWEHARHVALGLFCAVSLTDALDGYLARRLNEETPLGRFHESYSQRSWSVSSGSVCRRLWCSMAEYGDRRRT